MPLRTHHRVSLTAVIPLAVILLACGASSSVIGTTFSTATTSATATPAPSGSVVQVSNSQYFADSKSGGTSAPCANGDPIVNADCGETVTVSCPSGGVLLGGGYAVDDPLAFVSSSFPASATVWSITAHDEGQDGGSHAFTVTAYAECLTANFSAGVSAVTATPTIPHDLALHNASVNCPSGSVVTGGGFRGSPGSDQNAPIIGGWTVDIGFPNGSPTSPTIYALCSAQHLSAAGQPSVTAHPDMGTGTDVTVGCPAGALLAGGGVYTKGFGNITGDIADSAMMNWQARVRPNGVVGGPVTTYAVMDTAICLKMS